MHNHRSELGLLTFCAVPVLIAVYCFMHYLSTGSLPVPLPAISLPAFNFPGLPTDRLLPAGSSDMVQGVKDNAPVVVALCAIGLLAAIALIGIISDISGARRQALVEAASSARGLSKHPLDAPWLDMDPEEA